MDRKQKACLSWLVALALIGFVAVIAASVNDSTCLPNAVYDHWPALPQSGEPTLISPKTRWHPESPQVNYRHRRVQ